MAAPDLTKQNSIDSSVSTSAPAPLPDPNLASYDFSNGSTQFLFSRFWSLSLGTEGTTYTDLHIVFDIEKNQVSTSNKGKIQIYNLNDLSRQKYIKGTQIIFKAGYQGLVGTLFAGTQGAASRVINERKGPDIITTFELGDAERELTTSVFNKSYPGGSTYSQVLLDLVDAMGLTKGTVILPPEALADVYSSTVVLSGSVRQLLDEHVKKHNLTWSVDNAVVNVAPVGTPFQPEAVAVNQSTGMIGVPTMGNAGDNIVTFISLLNPKLKPGALCAITSTLVNGLYIVQNAHYEGDTHGDKWQVTCECSPKG